MTTRRTEIMEPNCPHCGGGGICANECPGALREAAHILAMLALQSGRYQRDADYRDAVDVVLAFTASRSVRAMRSAIRAPHQTQEERA